MIDDDKIYGPWIKKFAFTSTKMTHGESVWFKTYYERRVANYIDLYTPRGGMYETVDRARTTLDILRFS